MNKKTTNIINLILVGLIALNMFISFSTPYGIAGWSSEGIISENNRLSVYSNIRSCGDSCDGNDNTLQEVYKSAVESVGFNQCNIGSFSRSGDKTGSYLILYCLECPSYMEKITGTESSSCKCSEGTELINQQVSTDKGILTLPKECKSTEEPKESNFVSDTINKITKEPDYTGKPVIENDNIVEEITNPTPKTRKYSYFSLVGLIGGLLIFNRKRLFG